jgi:hypothetical protein
MILMPQNQVEVDSPGIVGHPLQGLGKGELVKIVPHFSG